MTSGYPAYPSTFGALPVDWRIPTASTTAMSRVIQAWARMPDLPVNEVPGNWAWLGPWSLRVWQMPGVKLSVLLLAVSAVLLCAAWVFGRRGKRGGASWLWVFVPPVAALIFWMATAPDPRFAGAMPWLLSVALVLLAAGRFDERQFRRALQTIAPSVALAVGVFLVFDASRSQTWKLRGGFAKIPKAEMQTRITASGVEVQVPLQGDQVWNSKLPAAPALDPHLQMRGAGLANGFRVSADE